MHAKPPASHQWDAVVIGAGLAGAVASYLLAKAGLSVLLVEAKSFPRPKVCGGCLNQRALWHFQQAGLDEVVDTVGGHPFDTIELHLAGKRLRLPLPPGLAVTREPLDAALVATAQQAGVTFLPNTSAKVLEESKEAFRTVALGESGQVQAKVVLACDGLGRTSVSSLKEFVVEQRPDSRLGLGTVVDASALPSIALHQALQMVVGRGGYVGFAACEANRVSIAAAFDRSELRQNTSPADAVCQLLEQAGVTVDPVLRTTLWRGTRPLSQISRRVAGHRVLLLGDAAGYVEPFTGEGMAAAVESARLAAPLAIAACQNWCQTIAADWQSNYTTGIRKKQRDCGRLAWLLRRPRLAGWVLSAVAAWPTLGAYAARRISAHRTE